VIRRAHELDPVSYVHATYVGTHYLWARREREAIVYFRKALELNPEFYMAHWGLSRVYPAL
jgi:tetratricopeptide (TPR) repeat protein